MFCPDCGKENDSSKSFCTKCGAALIRNPANKTEPSKPTNHTFFIGLIIFIVLCLIFYNPIMGYLNTNYLGKPSLHLGEFDTVPNFLSGDVQYKFQVYNSGNGAAKNVYATIGVTDTKSGESLASKQVFVGNLDPGESKIITATLPYSSNYAGAKFTVSLLPDWLH
jgi:hypothetical protein